MADPKDNRQAAREAARGVAEKAVQVGRDKQKASVDEQNARLASAKPTPIPEEIDMAILGHPQSEHEDDGSGPDLVQVKVMVPQDDAANKYRTRSLSATPVASTAAPPKHQAPPPSQPKL